MFSSVDAPIPPLRQDLEIIPYEENGEHLLILRDPAGYGDEMIVFKPEAWALFSLFDGRQTVGQLQREIFSSTEVHVDATQIIQIIQMLDEYFFLQSERFIERKTARDKEFLEAVVRPAIHAGQSYPEDPAELKAFLRSLFDKDDSPLPHRPPIGIITPHIDLRIGPEVYIPPFRHLAAYDDFDTVVIFGTSHYSSEDLFIASRKHLQTPLGTLQTDTEFIDLLHEKTGNIFTRNDTAHRQEHSVEFPAVFVRYLFGETKKVVPILVTSFEECIERDAAPSVLPKYTAFIEGFRETLRALGRKAAYILSVDWSHIGVKFGDTVPASQLFDGTRASDTEQLRALEAGDYALFRSLLHRNGNATRIDGFSCISTFFDLEGPSGGKLLAYDQWDERERDSGVTFAGMSFFK